ncbi:polyamine aminopropyltransferase [Thiohalophilus sp.]|uniref:polyamine aminopropyltransferase n=1 Tax=Thiohalophilus sp. TaxID=3028392 RepID=UPI002ACD9B31|nr:polyamine aminopropyltransferase [Thiohalophilus sp.]MDZ7661310.1 polyamine aminopropyltransferase [Thiohalophilus sp.]
MLSDTEWFTEICAESGSAFSFKIKEKLAEVQTGFQKIEIFETEKWGRLMVIDGFIMLTDRDNFLYHEMMTHPVLFTHPDPKRVLVIGGGDCGTLREVLQHPGVNSCEQVEIDEQVTRLSEQYFPDLCTANDDPRAAFHFVDGIQWVKDAETAYYDVIIVDSTDPIGPAEGLFTEQFYRDCHRALGADGLLVQQSESPLIHQRLLKAMHTAMADAGFTRVNTLGFPQPVYPSGWWSCTLAGKVKDLSRFREQDAAQRPFETRYYNPEIHRAAFALPTFLQQHLGI